MTVSISIREAFGKEFLPGKNFLKDEAKFRPQTHFHKKQTNLKDNYPKNLLDNG